MNVILLECYIEIRVEVTLEDLSSSLCVSVYAWVLTSMKEGFL